MYKVIEQNSFRAQAFDKTGLNVHRQPGQRSRYLALFVHGYGGSGYGTWTEMPRMVFEGDFGPRMDVALYDYASARRAITRRGANLELREKQLTQSLWGLDDYESIYLIGHSLGGMIVEAAAKRYLQALRATDDKQVTGLAALVLFASPRAGTGWANPVLGILSREFRWLHRFSDRATETDGFFSTSVEHRVAVSSGVHPRHLLPRFVCLATEDGIVREFSATFGVPDEQKLILNGTHTSIVKPTVADHPQVDWLHERIRIVEELRTQRRRELNHEQLVSSARTLPVVPFIVTEIWTDSRGLEWEEAYNEVRESSTTSSFTVHDRRYMSADVKTDLLISIHDADSVLAPESNAHATVKRVHEQFTERDQLLSVGISPVGASHTDAELQIRRWIEDDVSVGTFNIKGSRDVEYLRTLLSRWIQLVISRDPRRRHLIATKHEPQLGPDPYEEFGKPGLL